MGNSSTRIKQSIERTREPMKTKVLTNQLEYIYYNCNDINRDDITPKVNRDNHNSSKISDTILHRVQRK